MIAASLFAGIGGFDVGLSRAGVRTAWQVERNPAALRVLGRHFPEAQLHDDVRTFAADGPTQSLRCDLVCGGFPCQDLSVAGRRAGLAGERSGLFFEFMRIVERLAPRWVLIENVPGLLSSWSGDTPSSLGIEAGPGRQLDLDETSDFSTVLDTLQNLGYGTASRTLDAQWLGVAQQRERVFIVGCAGADWRRAAEVLFERESLPWDSPPRREAGADLARCLTGRTTGGAFGGDADTETLIPIDAIAYRTTGNDGCFETGDRVGALNTGTDRNQHVIAYQCHGSNVGPMGTLRAGNGNETGGVPFVVAERGRPEGRTLEFHQDNVANALLTPSGGRSGLGIGSIVSSGAVRRLTPRECERLQGFPDDWTAGESDTARYRMLGNAVAVPVAEWIARRIVAQS